MYVRAAAERSLSGTPMRLLIVDVPKRAIPMNRMFHARLEPLRAFVSSFPMDRILRASEKGNYPVNGILISRINLDCATGSTAAYNTTRVFEQ